MRHRGEHDAASTSERPADDAEAERTNEQTITPMPNAVHMYDYGELTPRIPATESIRAHGAVARNRVCQP
jgi:hypothetical protein